MHQDVGKVLRCPVDVSLDGVSPEDESVSLSSDSCDLTVDDCCAGRRAG